MTDINPKTIFFFSLRGPQNENTRKTLYTDILTHLLRICGKVKMRLFFYTLLPQKL